MIYFAVDEARAALLENYLAGYGRELRGRVRQFTYPDLFRARSLARGTWIFTSLEALSKAELQTVHLVERAARDAGLRVLNSARESLSRYDLLRLLRERGWNDFRAFRADEPLDSLRFPVFVRVANGHDGSLTPLLSDPAQLRRAMAYLRMRGLARHELLVVEFCETVSPDGMYRKYSVFRIGDAYIPRYLHIGPHWMTKAGTRESDETLIREEHAYLRENPHAEWVRQVFELARIDYGRLDYGVRDGHPQAWEINFTPYMAPNPNRPKGTPQQERVRALTRQGSACSIAAIGEAFLRLDPGDLAGDAIAIAFPPELVEQARRERSAMLSLARRQARIARWAAAPGLRAAGPMLRRMLGW